MKRVRLYGKQPYRVRSAADVPGHVVEIITSFCEFFESCAVESVCRLWYASGLKCERVLDVRLKSSVLSVWGPGGRFFEIPIAYIASHNCAIEELTFTVACTKTLYEILSAYEVTVLQWDAKALPDSTVAYFIAENSQALQKLRILEYVPEEEVLGDFLDCCADLEELEFNGYYSNENSPALLVNQFFFSERHIDAFSISTEPLFWLDKHEHPCIPGSYGRMSSNLRGVRDCILPHMLPGEFQALLSNNGSIEKLVVHEANVHGLLQFPHILGKITVLGIMEVYLSNMLDVAVTGILHLCPSLRTLILRPAPGEEDEARLTNTLLWCEQHAVNMNWNGGIMALYQFHGGFEDHGKDVYIQEEMYHRGLALTGD
jgi:hypothetical protein